MLLNGSIVFAIDKGQEYNENMLNNIEIFGVFVHNAYLCSVKRNKRMYNETNTGLIKM
ncbi:hypothetical protein SAMN05444375_1129 [Segatella baroniae B14]|nr:hypothetical protein SAMN05444375_1129 [Segatella baroniae B14]